MSRAHAGILFSVLVPCALDAQGRGTVFDRSKPPALAKPPVLTVPAVITGVLGNGVRLQVIEQHELPLVQVTLVVEGGTRLDGPKPGLASFSARMLTEGAGTRDANALVSELTFLGANLFAAAQSDVFTLSLNVPKRALGLALDVMADVALRPTFKAVDVKRQRDLRLAGILQRRDQATTLAAMAFNQLVFPLGHPYHEDAAGDSASAASLDSATVRSFYEHAFVPRQARFIVVGDVSEPEARALLAPRFGTWRTTAAPPPARVLVKPTVNDTVRVFLVDKPGAAQSVIYLGTPGVERLSPDYAAIVVMNTILGGSFSSRLMTNLRETRGYTYGVNSGFRWARLPGPFVVSSSVRTNVTDSSLIEIFKELRAIQGVAVDAKELERAKAYVALGVPSTLETNGQIASQLVNLGVFGLPLSSVRALVDRVNTVTGNDVQRVARQYIPIERLTLVVVGDLAKIRAGIEGLHLGPVSVLDVSSIAR